MYKISIIIPVYNVSDYIIRCIDSVINQTYQEIECLIIDDCSPDNSIELAENKLQSYKGSIDFRIIRHEQNKGVSEARNTGIRNATGNYLYFLDSDDEITNNCIETLVDLCKNEEEMVIGDYTSKGGKMNFHIDLQKPLYSNEDIFKAYINKQWYEMPWNKLIQKNFILANNLFFHPNISNHEDALWSFHVTSKLQSLNFTPKETYIYYVRENSLHTTYKLKRADETLLLLNEIVESSLHLSHNVSDYIIHWAIDSVDTIYYKILEPLSQKKLFYSYIKKIKKIVNKYPLSDLDNNARKRLFMVKHPLLCNIYYQHKNHKIVSFVFNRFIFKYYI